MRIWKADLVYPIASIYTIVIVGAWLLLWPRLHIPTSDPAIAALYGWVSGVTCVGGFLMIAFVEGYLRDRKTAGYIDNQTSRED